MKDQDKAQFMQLLADVMAFYRQDVSTFAVGVWWQACQSFDLDAVRKAMTGHAMDPDRGQFAPKPADIVRQLQGTHADRSLMAWGKVLEAIQRVGAYQSVVFDDAAIHAAIEDVGGWMAVCRSSIDELPHLQRRFCASHGVYLKRPGHAYPAKLLGEHEMQNRQNGYNSSPPVLIGDPVVAGTVMLEGGNGPKTQITTASEHLLSGVVKQIGGKAA